MEEPEETNGSRSPEERAEAGREETANPEELKARIEFKNNRIRELLEQITASRLAADEALVGNLQRVQVDDDDAPDEVGSLSASAEALRLTAAAPPRNNNLGGDYE